MAQEKPYARFSGDFRTAIRNYSFDRMNRDPKYRKAVNREMSRRRAARYAARAVKPQAGPVAATA